MPDLALIETIFYTTAAGLGATGIGAGVAKLFHLGYGLARVEVKVEELCERVEKVENRMPNGELKEIAEQQKMLVDRLDKLLS
jgi:hypothetical protein